jgi:hypothetical protein
VSGQEPDVKPLEGQEPDKPVGQEPDKTTTGGDGDREEGQEPKSPDPQWIKDLRQENARQRKALKDAEVKLREYEDRDKTELEKVTSRAETAEKTASEATGRLLRYEVAAAKGLTMDWVDRMRGDTRDELEQDADRLLEQLGEQYRPPTASTQAFDGGARQKPAEKRSPEEEHNDFLLGVLGRKRNA